VRLEKALSGFSGFYCRIAIWENGIQVNNIRDFDIRGNEIRDFDIRKNEFEFLDCNCQSEFEKKQNDH